jgi:hypothetical protein
MKLAKEKERHGFFFWGVGEVKITILLVRKYGVCFNFDSSQLRVEFPLNFFFS